MTAAAFVAVTVPVEPARAFEIFTSEIGLWWKRSLPYRFRPKQDGRLAFEPGIGGRLVECYPEGEPYEVGRVLDWAPGERLRFEWRGTNFRPGQQTEVEVRFRAVTGGTRVTVEHRGWETLPPDHPAFHGQAPGVRLQHLGSWWEALLELLRTHSC